MESHPKEYSLYIASSSPRHQRQEVVVIKTSLLVPRDNNDNVIIQICDWELSSETLRRLLPRKARIDLWRLESIIVNGRRICSEKDYALFNAEVGFYLFINHFSINKHPYKSISSIIDCFNLP